MRRGHLENTKTSITGNREYVIYGEFYTEENEAIEFLEGFNYEPCDILNLMHEFGINHTVRYNRQENYFTDDEICIIESEELIFIFRNDDIIYIAKKYNVLDELAEKYTLSII